MTHDTDNYGRNLLNVTLIEIRLNFYTLFILSVYCRTCTILCIANNLHQLSKDRTQIIVAPQIKHMVTISGYGI